MVTAERKSENDRGDHCIAPVVRLREDYSPQKGSGTAYWVEQVQSAPSMQSRRLSTQLEGSDPGTRHDLNA
jgi:hypothetical protein